MDAVNKERRDIKVCSNRTAAVKGGGAMGRWDLIILSPLLLRVGALRRTLGDANRWRCYYSTARNAAARNRPSACLITAHYGGKSDNNPHAAAGRSPGRSNGTDRNTDQLLGERSQTRAGLPSCSAICIPENQNNDRGN